MKRKSIFIATILSAVVAMSSAGRLGASVEPTEELTVVAAIVPVYGAIARTAHVGGEVTVEVVVDSKGKVKSAKPLGGHPLIASTAKEAAKHWLFTPSNASVDRQATLVFVFQMMPRCAPPADLTPIFYPPYKIQVRAETPPITCSDCTPKEQEKLRCQNP
jgi:Gram-negative bacterial TonB protein C-terminal